MEISEKLSKMIKSYRIEQNLSQAEFSKELGVAKSTLQKLERGELVAPQTLLYVSEKLGVELSIRPRSGPEDHAQLSAAIGKLLEAAAEVSDLWEAVKWN